MSIHSPFSFSRIVSSFLSPHPSSPPSASFFFVPYRSVYIVAFLVLSALSFVRPSSSVCLFFYLVFVCVSLFYTTTITTTQIFRFVFFFVWFDFVVWTITYGYICESYYCSSPFVSFSTWSWNYVRILLSSLPLCPVLLLFFALPCFVFVLLFFFLIWVCCMCVLVLGWISYAFDTLSCPTGIDSGLGFDSKPEQTQGTMRTRIRNCLCRSLSHPLVNVRCLFQFSVSKAKGMEVELRAWNNHWSEWCDDGDLLAWR